jgi:hypothetical protein
MMAMGSSVPSGLIVRGLEYTACPASRGACSRGMESRTLLEEILELLRGRDRVGSQFHPRTSICAWIG